MPDPVSSAFATEGHDHQRCVETALDAATEAARAAQKPLSGTRLAVLKALLGAHTPQGAYELRDALHEEGLRLQPVQVYRALDALRTLGLVHRVESRNAFIACTAGPGCREPQLLICSGCGRVAELGDDAVEEVVRVAAARTGFDISHAQIELTGLCPRCRAAG